MSRLSDLSETMSAAALDAMIHVLDLAPDDRVVVVTDPQTLRCGEAFAIGAENHGCPVTRYTLPAEGRPLSGVPDAMVALIDEADVIINAIVGDAREVPFRIEWIHAIENAGRIRMGHSPGIDEDMMTSGPLNVDYEVMVETSSRLRRGLAGADQVHLTTPAGTDLWLNLEGRRFVDDLKATPEAGANLPCGEVYCAPVETGAEGVLVVDGCYGSHGTVPAPVVITVQGGRCVDLSGEHMETLRIITDLMNTDAGSRSIAELGIGLNPGARLTDHMLEAEKAHHTAHVAFGDNEGIAGGQGRSSMHIDYLILKPTIEVFRGGGSHFVMEEGEVV
jgi:leucyl aminopeptidase (aminopeptidase T)